MALTPEQIAEIIRETWGCASIAPRHAVGFARAIEAEVRKQDDALIRQMLEALEAGLNEVNAAGQSEGIYFGDDKDVDHKMEAAISTARARLGEKPT